MTLSSNYRFSHPALNPRPTLRAPATMALPRTLGHARISARTLRFSTSWTADGKVSGWCAARASVSFEERQIAQNIPCNIWCQVECKGIQWSVLKTDTATFPETASLRGLDCLACTVCVVVWCSTQRWVVVEFKYRCPSTWGAFQRLQAM